jgi:predicted metal-dependent enzyme (double-stranded beta helix superfamily)
MDPKLEAYIADVRGIVQRKLSSTGRLRRIREAAGHLVADGLELDERSLQVPADGYGRNLLYRDNEYGFVVIAMVWPAGYVGVPHDHKTWGVVSVLEGEVDVLGFERDDDGSDPTRCELTEVESIRGAPGAVAQVLPPHHDIHSVSNASGERQAITIHTYGRDAETVNCFDLETGAVEVLRPTYTSVPDAVAG